jgi:hypothetical protein
MSAIPAALIQAGGQIIANQQTAASTAKQMAFQKYMSNTAHQRQIADLKAAGLNPILSAKLGGASTPQGASYVAHNVGAAAVQGYSQGSSAKQVQTSTAIEQRTLDMLERENVSMPEIQYTVKNIFQSKALRTVEAGLAGKPEDAPSGIYRSLSVKIQAMASDAGLLKGQTSSIEGVNLGRFISNVTELFTKAGISALTDLGKKVLNQW